MRLKTQLPSILLAVSWMVGLTATQGILPKKKPVSFIPTDDRQMQIQFKEDIGQENVHPPLIPLFKNAPNQNKVFDSTAKNVTKKKSKCPPTVADCLCDTESDGEHIIQVQLKTISIVDPRTGHRRCFADEDPCEACEKHQCFIIPNNNFEMLFQKGKKIIDSNYLDNNKEVDSPPITSEKKIDSASGPSDLDDTVSAFYPLEFTYPRSFWKEGHSRLPRSVYGSNVCRVPSLANSEVTCWKWPNWQTCKQTCIYAHGLDNGGKTIKEKSFSCRNTENKWKPHIIRDCEPYMNCKVHLRAPGDLNCIEPTDGPAYCDITCADYDDYKGHGRVRWKCDENAILYGKGGKGSRLPYCAEFEEADIRLGPPEFHGRKGVFNSSVEN